MTEIEHKLNELESKIQSFENTIDKLVEENESLKQELKDIYNEKQLLLESKYRSNSHLIDDNNRYARSYEDRYFDVEERIERLEQIIDGKK